MSSFIWITGLPGVGKTTLLKDSAVSALYVDQIRDEILIKDCDALLTLRRKLDLNIEHWPLTRGQFHNIHSSYQRYIFYSQCIAELIYPHLKYKIASAVGLKFVEVSPFVLSCWAVQEKIIFKTLPDNLHVKNLAKRFGLPVNEANAYLDFYINSYESLSIKPNITLVKSLNSADLNLLSTC